LLYGILLRWTLMHRLSPAHGFLHETTGYPSLTYDLMEPYRYIIEHAVAHAMEQGAKDVTAATLAMIKQALDEYVYVPCVRAYARRKNLLHGIVLALRAYLIRETRRLIVPTEGQPCGGRRPNVGYALPGARRQLTPL
jgi:hypothetical protein